MLCPEQDRNANHFLKFYIMAKVTGIGGVFFKCKDPKALYAWYKKHLGLDTSDYGVSFVWGEGSAGPQQGLTQWSLFSDTTKYFAPSEKEFMINYLVDDLEALVKELKEAGVNILDDMETHDYGKFVHLLDPEWNKIELWEAK